MKLQLPFFLLFCTLFFSGQIFSQWTTDFLEGKAWAIVSQLNDKETRAKQISILADTLQQADNADYLLDFFYYRIGADSYYLERYHEAIGYSLEVIADQVNCLNTENYGKWNYGLGVSYRKKQQPDFGRSTRHLIQASESFSSKTGYLKSATFRELGGLFADLGEFVKSDFYYSNAINEIEKYLSATGDIEKYKEQRGKILISKSRKLVNSKNNYRAAISGLYEGLNLLENKPKQQSIAHTNLADTYDMLGKNEQKQSFFDSAIVHYKIAFIHGDSATQYNNLSTTYIKMGRVERALSVLDSAQKICLRKQDKELLAMTHDNQGDAFLADNQSEVALEHYQKAIEIITPGFKSTGPMSNPNTELLLGVSFKKDLFTYLSDKAKCLKILSSTSKNAAYLKAALDTYLAADKVIDYMRQEQVELHSKLFWRSEVKSIYESAISICKQLKDYQTAFHFFEKSKSILLLEGLQLSTFREQLMVKELQYEMQLQDSLLNQKKAYQNPELTSQMRSEIYNKITSLEKALTQFIRKHYPKDYYEKRYVLAVNDMTSARNKLLNKKTILVHYFYGADSIYCLGLPHDGTPILFSADRNSGLDDNISSYIKLFHDKKLGNRASGQQYTKLAYNIYSALYAPIAKQWKDIQTAIILPDGPINLIPFDGLIVSYAPSLTIENADYLILMQESRYGYSATVLINQNKKNGQMQRKLKKCMFFAPAFDNNEQGQSKLVYTDTLEKRITALYGDSNVVSLCRENATTENLKTHFNRYKIVHLHTHGMAIPDSLQPRIYTLDSYLTFEDFNSISTSADVVILSVCETALGDIEPGEGIFSISRSFTSAGAASLISTLWEVNEYSTTHILIDYYQNLKRGASKATALHQAKLSFIDSSPNHINPSYWSGIVFIGEGGKADLALSHRLWIILVFVFIAAGSFLLYIKQMRQ